MRVRPLHDWVVVLLEKDQEPSSIIVAPGTHEEIVRRGTVVHVGPGKELPNGLREPVGVAPGDRVCFVRWHNEHRPGKAQVAALMDMSEALGGPVVMIRANDILFAFEGEFRVEVTSL